MCRDNSLYSPAHRISVRYDLHDEDFDDKEYYSPRWHILAGYHSQHVIVNDSVIKKNIAFPAHWGLIPHYSKDFNKAKQDSFRFVNARSETVFEKPMFKNLIIKRRCLVPSNGFFEHYESPVNGTKIPFHVRIKDAELFSIAGIYTYASFNVAQPNTLEGDGVDKTEEIRVISFAMLTTSANELMQEIHNSGENQHRMPLMLNKDMEKEYLDNDLSEASLRDLIKFRIDSSALEAWPVKSIRARGKTEDESILMTTGNSGGLIKFDYEHFNLR